MPWIKILLTKLIVPNPGLRRLDGSGAGLFGGR